VYLRRSWCVKPCLMRCMRDGRVRSSFSAVMCVGSIQKASTRLMPSVTVTTKGMTNMNLPTMPGSSMSGRKAAIVVSTAEVIGAAVSRSASSEAASTCCPRCTR